MQLRVRSLDGVEIVLDVPHHGVCVPVAEIKRRALSQLLKLRGSEALRGKTAANSGGEELKASDSDIGDADLAAKLANAWLAFRGELLADADTVNLFALVPADFFVLVEEPPSDGDDSRDAAVEEAEEEESKAEDDDSTEVRRRRKRQRTGCESGEESAVSAESVSALVEMGFAQDQARAAMQVAGGELSRAVALLMGEADPAAPNGNGQRRDRLSAFVRGLVRRYPELADIKPLLMHEQVHAMKRLAANSDFDTLVALKESFPAHWLAQMNENPAATVLFLVVPEQLKQRGRTDGARVMETTRQTDQSEIDLTSGSPIGDAPGFSAKDRDAIDRLTSMGFAFDLVAAVYESCGGNEEVAANLLLETLQ